MKKLNDAGSALYVVLVLVVVAIVGVAGYLVWNNSRDKETDDVTDSSQTESQSTPESFLTIDELGVKLKLNSDTEDLYYVVNSESGDGVYAELYSRKLAALDERCSEKNTTNGALGVVDFYTNPSEPDPFAGTSTMAEAFPDAVMVGSKYVYLSAPTQSTCYDEAKYNDTDEVPQLNSKLKGYLKSATLEAL